MTIHDTLYLISPFKKNTETTPVEFVFRRPPRLTHFAQHGVRFLASLLTKPSLLTFKTNMMQVSSYTANLNNIGVSLLERKCYRQAFETLHDSVQLTRKHQISPFSTLPKKLVNAYQRQCKPEPFKLESPLHLQVVTDNSDSDECLRATHSQDACIAIRLEGFDSTNDVQMDFAVILQNYAVAALCLAHAHPSSKTSTSILQTCLQSLLQCQKELAARYAALDGDSDWELVQKAFVIAAVSTKNLLLVLQSLGEEFESQIVECQDKLDTLNDTMSELEHCDTGATAAAAA
jgi:hypothetical protein